MRQSVVASNYHIFCLFDINVSYWILGTFEHRENRGHKVAVFFKQYTVVNRIKGFHKIQGEYTVKSAIINI